MTDKQIFVNVFKLARPYKKRFVLVYFILLLELFTGKAIPLFISRIVNCAVYYKDVNSFLLQSLICFIIFLVYVSCGYVQLQLWQRLNNQYVYHIRLNCYHKIMKLKANYLSNVKTGDLINLLNNDTNELHHIIQRYAMRTVNAGIGTLIGFIIMFMIKWELAVLMVIIIPLSNLSIKRIEKHMKEVASRSRKITGDYNSWLMELLKYMSVIKVFAAEKTANKQFVKKNNTNTRINVELSRVQFQSDQLINSIYFIGLLIFYAVCAFFVAKRKINIGDYIALSSYFTYTSNNFKQILNSNVEYQRRKVGLERVFELLAYEEESNEGLRELEIDQYDIKFDSVSYSYEGNKNVLQDITINIKDGEHIGIVGSSGEGKSTLTYLILKLYQPTIGHVLINGKNLENYTYSSIRNLIGVVSQDIIIFNATIKDNISLFEDASDELIWDALEKAYLKEDIEKLPDGIDTLIGLGGCELSGGQNQRLSIARMIYKNPKIIILDEATSSLDKKSEENVQNALYRLQQNRTCIVITHRLATLKSTNRILILKDKAIVEENTYENMIQTSRLFQSMFLHQIEEKAYEY